ncbi:NAD(P)H-dependent flavin oxidoreductase [Halopiger xanaduensis]|uniref:2-nitropropane dioxygenase NPD n=1 Tax=Halopiger xanaduensis (strain DSM 18323 / JCM 14033 / SH-6) TaxID=797210 RepID=F8D3K6_HALXS|nr:nitronate monooxygenase [Halopiger xanaduensis]AEH37371.1 2-nitropropane dioxygenase NPD [Halopiger xanaduensis SH-6]
MALRTPLCDALEIEHPIVQAPIGSATNPDLAAAVSNAGGLGHLAVTWRGLEETRDVIHDTRDRTDAPFAVNLALDDATTIVDTDDHLETALEAGAPIVSFSFGDAAPYVDRVHDAGAVAMQTVGSAAAAREAVDAGIDVVVTQGLEAGGHVQSEVATTALVPRVADAVGDAVPIVAAGGIADGRGVAAALALGADGAWLGTRFVATEEAIVHDEYRRRLRESDETDTEYTTLFDKGWPGTAHRVLANETLERWDDDGRPPVGERPGENDVIARTGDGEPIERYDEALATPDVEGDIESMALYAGQSVGGVDDVRPAATVVENLVGETTEAISSLPGRTG